MRNPERRGSVLDEEPPASSEEVATLQDLLAQMTQVLNDDASYVYETYLEIDIAFHATILQACHNELLSQIGSTMREAVYQAREHDTSDIDLQKQSLPFHVAIIDGIANRDPDAAYRASQRMFDDVWQYIQGR